MTARPATASRRASATAEDDGEPHGRPKPVSGWHALAGVLQLLIDRDDAPHTGRWVALHLSAVTAREAFAAAYVMNLPPARIRAIQQDHDAAVRALLAEPAPTPRCVLDKLAIARGQEWTLPLRASIEADLRAHGAI